MNSLVGYGLSSESEDDIEDGVNDVGDDYSAEEYGGSASTPKTRNFLLEPDSGSSDSDSESDTEELSSSAQLHQITSAPVAAGQATLPAPFIGSLTPNKLPPPSLNSHSDSSVFANPFNAQVDQKLSALQKHVPLTMQSRPSQIGGKRICVLYRKDGKCRFGINCKFAHDSDLQTPVPPTAGSQVPICKKIDEIVAVKGSQNLQQVKKEDSSAGLVKKRRVGLSNSLIPPKRAMKQYNLQRKREEMP